MGLRKWLLEDKNYGGPSVSLPRRARKQAGMHTWPSLTFAGPSTAAGHTNGHTDSHKKTAQSKVYPKLRP